MTQEYIGVKKVTAFEVEVNGQAGYRVIYPDGYSSWCPKETFEKAYFPVGSCQVTKITEDVVENFIAKYEDSQFDEKTALVKATLANGYTILEHSSCVDPANYNHELGVKNCKNKIKNKVWELLGFMLQTAINGVKGQ